MLRELRVKDFAIIGRLSVGFKPGLNVLSGETGAGKSILIGALGVALGERAYSEMIKTGSPQASVEAYFDITAHPLLETMGINSGEGIILRRDILSSGKGRAYINDTMVNVQSLSELGKTLIDIHGQHEHQSLLNTENQLRLIDRFSRLEKQREDIKSLYDSVLSLKRHLDDLKSHTRDRAQRVDLLRFQISEIDSAGLMPDEDRRLDEERNLLFNMSRLKELAEAAYEALYSREGSSMENLSAVIARLKELASIDRSMAGMLDVLESAMPLLQEASSELRDRKEGYNFDPERLASIDDRLHMIKGLKRKYGDTIDAILRHRDKIKEEFGLIETSEEKSGELEKELKEKEERLIEMAMELSRKRLSSAKGLQVAVKALLKGLALEKADFSIDIRKTAITPAGGDAVEFLFSANPGEALKSLGKVVSGGELSRVMLAIKSVFGEADNIPVMIFDEVDAGIGGKTADNVAKKLKEISRGRQVICITHLPQIASAADSHLLIEKVEQKGGVNVIIKELSGAERLEEIARMLSGKITEVSMRHAGELLQRSL